ncbi:patatin-like phospholipase family protein [Schleiferilactobacillus shenzhenensis]|uniref:PNPLA domain-containing protein n=1 Tax=Schleiferilactobacillus shenzhenensis LY-73 TaxID=1231336 RepID=U4TQ43_9LACO|nr:patatin-like phospholipase family protein [Schleiferilactobacillus shenzhenensis]ERL65570.1 hypothetical protein L248_2643 [Schleiferilactobacillus shenzhenensis LY-73]
MQPYFRLLFDQPYCLVLGGGGAKGAFEIGAASVLWAHRPPAAIVGSSIGGFNGVLLQGSPAAAWAYWQKITPADLFVHPDCPLRDPAPLAQLLRQYIAVHPLTMPLWITNTALPGGGQVVALTPENCQDRLPQLIGGGSFFPLLKPQRDHGRWLTDGGMWNDLPITVAAHQGYHRVVATYIAGYGPIAPTPAGTQVWRIASPWHLGGFLNFNPAQSRFGYQLGQLTTRRQLNGDTGWYTLLAPQPNEWPRRIAQTQAVWWPLLVRQFPELGHLPPVNGLTQLLAAQRGVDPSRPYIVPALLTALRQPPGPYRNTRLGPLPQPLLSALTALRKEILYGT